MKRLALAAIFALSAAPPAAYAYNMNDVVGLNIGNKAVQANPVMQQVIAKAMGYLTPAQRERVGQFFPDGVSGPINGINDVYYLNACMPHLCSDNAIVIAAAQDAYGQKSDSVWVLLTLDGRTTIYGNPWDTVLKVMQTPNEY